MHRVSKTVQIRWLLLAGVAAVPMLAFAKGNRQPHRPHKPPVFAGADGPANQGPDFPHPIGNAANGQQVFRFETFGNEGFWTDAARLPQGIVAAGITPKQALQVGLSVNVDALDAATKAAVAAEIASQGTNGPLLNDPATTIALLNANAVIGVVVRDTNGSGTLDVAAGDKVGVSCASCHAITDGSVLNVPGGGSIGKELDGLTNHNLDVGAIFALAANSRALYPLLQLKLAANGNTSIGRAPASAAITEMSTESEVDSYLSNHDYYPVGTFDDAPDGTGAPQHIVPFFRTDLAAPFGTPGDIARLDNFNNLVYSVLLDPTVLTTPDGRNFLKALGGAAAGTEIADDYAAILADTGVTGYPFVQADLPVGVVAGSEAAPAGRRVNQQKLDDLNAYTDRLHPLPGVTDDPAAIERGRIVFRSECTSCHNVDQTRRVPSFVVPEATIFPGYDPVVLAQRPVELPFRPMAFAPIQDDPSTIFDDKTVIVEASRRGEVRGSALPLLMDLARKPNFLHDSSVASLESLLDDARGMDAPHPFYVDASDRSDVVAFLKSLDDGDGVPPGECSDQPSLTAVGCRLSSLLAQVNAGTDLGNLQGSLRAILQRALDQLEKAGSSNRSPKNALKPVDRALRAFDHRVRSLDGRRTIPATTRTALLEASALIRNAVESLRFAN